MKEPENILKSWNIDKHWSLFLDRDGVINRRIPGDYVKKPEAFIFLPGVKEALKDMALIFGKIFVVTNQQGIGKGLMSEEDLNKVHQYMLEEVIAAGGRIDRIYFSPYLAECQHPMRKPNTGMALKAREDFPEISFEHSVMIGDSPSDILFGKQCGMKTIFINSGFPDTEINADFQAVSLIQVADKLKQVL